MTTTSHSSTNLKSPCGEAIARTHAFLLADYANTATWDNAQHIAWRSASRFS
jgi:hypothetical protein